MKQIFISLFISAVVFISVEAALPRKENPQQSVVKAKLLEKITRKPGELIIPYEKWQLPNGLTIVIHEDHSDPILYFDVTYHVGSNREQVGRSGFAHFFEHMMFQGSDHVADEEHFKTVSEAGGTLNGSTNFDRTNYFETVPSNYLERMFWLESDRMGFLLDAVTQPKFEVQRATVKNERGQNYDNRPYGLAFEKTLEALFPYGHPYSWSTIGYIEDLNRVDVGDLKRFFLRWYGPNNATLTVAGDVKPEEVIKYAEKYFMPIPRGPEVKNIQKQMGVLDKDRYISYEDNIRFPMLMATFPSVPAYDKDEAALDALASILSEDKNSIFYQNFVKAQKAYDASVNNFSAEVTGMFFMQVRALPDKAHTTNPKEPAYFPLAKTDSLLHASLMEFEKRGVSDEDLKKFKAKFEARTVQSLSSVRGKGAQLAANQTFTGNPDQIRKDMQRYMALTKEDVMRVFNQYVKNKPAVYLSVVPKGKTNIAAKPDNFQPPKRNAEDGKESAEYKNLSYNKAKDNFDRSKKPGSGANPVVKVPDFWTENFSNGMKVIGMRNDEIPTVNITVSMETGHRAEELSKAGLAHLTASLMDESTQQHTAEQIDDMLSLIGSEVSFSADDEEITFNISSLVKNLDATLKIAEEKLFQPKFAQEDFDRLKEEQLNTISNQSTQPVVIANNVYRKLLYGKAHILSTPIVGTKESASSLTLEEVKNFYANKFSPSIVKTVVAGDVTKENILPKLGFLKTWQAKKVENPQQPATPSIDKTRIYFVNKDNAPQSEERIGFVSLPYDATGEFYRTSLANYILGGAFNSRINLNLREEKGWTYGARSGFYGTKYAAPFTAQAGIKGDATDSAIVEFMKEIKNYADAGIKDDELAFTKSSIGQQDALRYETNGQKSFFIKRILDYNLSKDFVDKQQEILKKISKEEINKVAKKNLPYNNMVIVIVGNRAKYLERIKKLGYEVIELDAEGNQL
ncbi:MAG: insulinase family protein [Bacteroidetes bacterium]|nr:insulinase family protein [Bacteroidota bacterium]